MTSENAIPNRPPGAKGVARPPALALLTKLVGHPALAYAAILFVQLRVLWGIWSNRDLTSGDTSSYFIDAVSWAHGAHDNIVWSPLYTDFLGTLVAVIGDVPTALIVHRVVIVLVVTVLVLAVMRALVGAAIGTMLALWWAVLPPNYNMDYEVHAFGMIPVLAAILIVARGGGAYSRGIALAVLAATTLLLRNELVIAVTIFGGAILIAEVRARRNSARSGRSYFLAYGVPLVAVALLFFGAYERSRIQGETAKQAFAAKQGLNVCQVYAFTYQQRYPDRFVKSPWTDCAPLMVATFGRPYPTLLQAARANPAALARFVGWNASLLPSGLQVGLFGGTSTGSNPGFLAVRRHRTYALVLSALLLALLIAGAALLRRDWAYWRSWVRPRRWALILLAGTLATGLFVALTERPRAEYLYGITICAFVATGFCVLGLARGLGALRWLGPVASVVMLVACVFAHSAYRQRPRPLYNAVERLQIVKDRLQMPGSVLIASGYNFETCAYLARSYQGYCTSPSWASIAASTARPGELERRLQRAKATVIYADPIVMAEPTFSALLRSPRQMGWLYAARGVGEDGPWAVLVRSR